MASSRAMNLSTFRLVSSLSLAAVVVGCGAAASTSPRPHARFAERGLLAARGQFGIEHGGVRRERVATPAWQIANFAPDLSATSSSPEYAHQARLEGAPARTEDVFELALQHTRVPARIWVRTVPLPRALEARELAQLAPGIVERSVHERHWLFDDVEGAGPRTYQTRSLVEAPCQLDGLPAHEVLYEARSASGHVSHVHLVLVHALKPWRAAGERGAGHRPLVVLGLASAAELHAELAPQLADLAHRVRVFDGEGQARAQGASSCGVLRSEPLRGTRFRVGDYVVYRSSGAAVGEPLLVREEITDQDGERLTVEVTLSREGQTLRRWAQELIDSPAHRAAPLGAVPLEALCVFEGEACLEQPIEALSSLVAGLLVTPEEEPTNVTQTHETRPIGPLQLECEVRRGETRVAGRAARFEELHCPDFLWGSGPSAFVDADNGDFLLQRDVVEFGSPLGPWRWGTFGAPLAR